MTTKSQSNKSMKDVGSSLTVNVLTTQAEFDELESQWNALVENPEVEAHIFQTFEWQRLWWKNFGDGNALQIFTVWSDRQLVGLAPLFVDKTSVLGFYDYKELKFIGSSVSDSDPASINSTFSYYLDLIVLSDYQDVVVEEFISYLEKTRERVDSIVLDDFSEESIVLNEILLRVWQDGWKFDGKLKEESTQIMLSDAVEDDRGSNNHDELPPVKRDHEDENLFRVHQVVNKKEVDSAFANFVELYQKQWSQQGYPGVFANNKYKNFLREVAEVFADKGKLKMSKSLDDMENCVAVNLAFEFKDKVYNYQMAFEVKDALKTLTDSLIEDAIKNNIQHVDLLRNKVDDRDGYTEQTTRNLKVTISGYAPTNTMKNYLHRVVQNTNTVKEQLEKEWTLLKTHINQWVFSGF